VKLAEHFGHTYNPLRYQPSPAWELPACRIGLEWEWENASQLVPLLGGHINPYLDIKQDGSLRDNGYEVVTRGDGFFCEDLLAAVHAMNDLYKKAKPTTGYRTAFHAHIDVRDMEAREVHNLLLLYCLVEKPIFNFVGKGRDNSNFCVPWYRSDAQFEVLRLLGGDTADYGPIKGLQRYSALNVQAVAKLGTVEFRQMENDGEEITTKQIAFINYIMRLKAAAMEYAGKGLYGEDLFNWAKRLTAMELLDKLGLPLPVVDWEYTDSLMLASMLVSFRGSGAMRTFIDAYFAPFYGQHPRWR
jgi:hypothetical protein